MPTNTQCVGFERPAAAGSNTDRAVRCTEDPNARPLERPGMRTVINFELDDVDPQAEAE